LHGAGVRGRLALGGQVHQLSFAEGRAAGLGESTIEHACEVAQVEAYRSQTQRPLGKLFDWEIGQKFGYFFAGLQQGMGHGL
jgi:hypothetical protein